MLFSTIGIEHRHSNPSVGLNIQPRPTHLGLDSTPPRKQSSVETKTDYGKYRYCSLRYFWTGTSKLKANSLSVLNVVTGLIDQCFIFIVNPTKICLMLSKNLIRFVIKNETPTMCHSMTPLYKTVHCSIFIYTLLSIVDVHSTHLLFV